MNLKNKSRFLRYKKISNLARGEIVNLGSHDGDLDKLLRKKHEKVSSVDLGGADFIINLNNKNWKINKKFDTVIAGEIIEHLENPVQFLENCSKLLKKNGRLILSTPNASSLIYLKNPWWCVDYQVKADKEVKFTEDLTHVHAFTTGMLEFLFKRVRMKNVRYEYLNGFIYNPIAYLICTLIPRIRGDILIWGDKY